MVANTRGYWAPVLESGVILAEENPKNQTYRPAVIVHGMGDAVSYPPCIYYFFCAVSLILKKQN